MITVMGWLCHITMSEYIIAFPFVDSLKLVPKLMNYEQRILVGAMIRAETNTNLHARMGSTIKKKMEFHLECLAGKKY